MEVKKRYSDLWSSLGSALWGVLSENIHTHARVGREIKYIVVLKYLGIKDLSGKREWRSTSISQLDVCFRSHSVLLSLFHVLSAVFLPSNCLTSASYSLQWQHYVWYIDVS